MVTERKARVVGVNHVATPPPVPTPPFNSIVAQLAAGIGFGRHPICYIIQPSSL